MDRWWTGRQEVDRRLAGGRRRQTGDGHEVNRK